MSLNLRDVYLVRLTLLGSTADEKNNRSEILHAESEELGRSESILIVLDFSIMQMLFASKGVSVAK